MRNLLFFLLLLTGFAQAQQQVVIASWNIENLDGNRKQAPEDLARHLVTTGAHVIALQEIHDTGPELGNKRLEKTLALLGPKWGYRLFPNKPPNEKARLCGVAWNTEAVEIVGAPYRVKIQDDPNDDYKIWHRHPHAQKFRVKGRNLTDFVVVPIHMKSNRRPKGKSEFFTRQQRGLEGKTLADQLPAIKKHFGGESDIIVVGDTNCLDVAEPGLQAFRDADLRDLNLRDFNTHMKGRAPFDRFFVPRNQPEFAHSRQLVLSPTDRTAYDERASDHLVILTTVEVMRDDD